MTHSTVIDFQYSYPGLWSWNSTQINNVTKKLIPVFVEPTAFCWRKLDKFDRVKFLADANFDKFDYFSSI